MLNYKNKFIKAEPFRNLFDVQSSAQRPMDSDMPAMRFVILLT